MNLLKTKSFFFSNIQVESLKVYNVRKYDEELFSILFDFTNKLEIGKIYINLYEFLFNEDVKNICPKIEDKITQSVFSNDVSCFI